MKILRTRNIAGYALMMTLFFSGVSMLTLAGALRWCSSTARTTNRNNSYYSAQAAAEAATEKVLANIAKDYQAAGEANVYSRLSTYQLMVPTTAENSYWSKYGFANAQGADNQTYVQRTVAWAYTNLSSQYEGLKGMASTYRIVANARTTDLSPSITAAVRQDVQVASIPIFQFAIFYSMDLEVNPSPVMNVTGRVHSNANIYNQPTAGLTYKSHVTAAQKIIIGKSPLDPLVRTQGPVTFQGEDDSGVSTLSLPIGTNNTPAAVRAVVEIPPSTEDATSLMGQQRYHNKSDLIILVSNTTVTAKSGAWNSFGTSVPFNTISTFVNTNITFYNKREGKTIRTTEIDVAKLILWSATNTTIRPGLNRDVSSIYVADMRTGASSYESGVRMVNGQVLPSQGLTVSTPNPTYIKGHYNAPTATLGTTNTTGTKPASIVADAITILSKDWSDANSDDPVSSRPAGSTTVNAAFLAGIVQSNGVNYSGGVENFPRFLENWSGDTFTYNGSMVVMFPSQIATAPWGGDDVYSPPNRNWAFDLNFMDATKLPPGTPQLLTLIRGSYAIISPNTIN